METSGCGGRLDLFRNMGKAQFAIECTLGKYLLEANIASLENARRRISGTPERVINAKANGEIYREYLYDFLIYCPIQSIKYCVLVGWLTSANADNLFGKILVSHNVGEHIDKLRVLLEAFPRLFEVYNGHAGECKRLAIINRAFGTAVRNGDCAAVASLRELFPNYVVTMGADFRDVNHLCDSCVPALFPRGIERMAPYNVGGMACLVHFAKLNENAKKMYLSTPIDDICVAYSRCCTDVLMEDVKDGSKNDWICAPIRGHAFCFMDIMEYVRDNGSYNRYSRASFDGLSAVNHPLMAGVPVYWSELSRFYSHGYLSEILKRIPERITFDSPSREDMLKQPAIFELLPESVLEEQYTVFLKCDSNERNKMAVLSQLFLKRCPMVPFTNIKFEDILIKRRYRKDIGALRHHVVSGIMTPLLIGQAYCPESPMFLMDSNLLRLVFEKMIRRR